MKALIAIALLLIIGSCTYNNKPDEIDAQIQAERFVETKLKSPGSADFGGTTVDKISDREFTVEGYVDAQNAFGGLLRVYYRVNFTYSQDFKKITVNTLEISD